MVQKKSEVARPISPPKLKKEMSKDDEKEMTYQEKTSSYLLHEMPSTSDSVQENVENKNDLENLAKNLEMRVTVTETQDSSLKDGMKCIFYICTKITHLLVLRSRVEELHLREERNN